MLDYFLQASTGTVVVYCLGHDPARVLVGVAQYPVVEAIDYSKSVVSNEAGTSKTVWPSG